MSLDGLDSLDSLVQQKYEELLATLHAARETICRDLLAAGIEPNDADIVTSFDSEPGGTTIRYTVTARLRNR